MHMRKRFGRGRIYGAGGGVGHDQDRAERSGEGLEHRAGLLLELLGEPALVGQRIDRAEHQHPKGVGLARAGSGDLKYSLRVRH